MKKSTLALVAAAAVAALAAAPAALAEPVTYIGSSGGLSASAGFEVFGTSLHVTLLNTSGADVVQPNQVLTGMFFDIAGDPLLTRVSATTLGATMLGGIAVSGAGAAVGGEWAYLNGLAQYGANSGISSAGQGIFGPADVFPPGTNLAGPTSPNGLQYGITSALDLAGTGNIAVTGTELTRYGVEFVLDGWLDSMSLSNISGVTFQYGASLTDGHFAGVAPDRANGVPEPGSLALVAAALLGIAGLRSRTGRREPAPTSAC